jgi:AraC-like DNA-binding protein
LNTAVHIYPPNREWEALDLRPIGIREVPMVGRYNYVRAQRGLTPHDHPGTLEICYLAKGTQLYRVGNRDFVMRGGDIFLTRPGEVHSTGEAPQEKGMLYWIQFLVPSRPTRFLNCQGDDARSLVDALNAIPHRHFPGAPDLGQQLDEVLRLAVSNGEALQLVTLRCRLLEFLLRVIECSRGQPAPSVSPEINRLLREIEAQVEEPLNLADLAARANLSLSRFKARFKQEVGIPPAEYIQRCKIDAAKRLLSDRRHNVTAIAFRLGFSSSQYFATVFKRYTGKAPGQWSSAAPMTS